MSRSEEKLDHLFDLLFQAHPWHGVPAGPDVPEWCTCFVEIVPSEGVKYELDKPSGLLKIDRPQRYSSLCPSLYGFIPQTYCATEVARRGRAAAGVEELRGDGDPLDVCILSEKAFSHGGFLLRARPVGGLRMIDGEEADDKIVAVLEGDLAYGAVEDLADLPGGLVDRLRHYFLSYKQLPSEEHTPSNRRVRIAETYGRKEAHTVIQASIADYRAAYGDPDLRVGELRRLIRGSG